MRQGGEQLIFSDTNIFELTYCAGRVKQGDPPREPHQTISRLACLVLADHAVFSIGQLGLATAAGDKSGYHNSVEGSLVSHLQRRNLRLEKAAVLI